MNRRAVATTTAVVAVVTLLEITAHPAHATAALVEHGDPCCVEPESSSTCRLDRPQ